MSAIYSSYFARLLGAIAAGLLLVAAANLLIDPYGLWRVIDMPRVNAAKPEKENVDNLFKPIDVARRKPDVVLLGSSRAAFGLDPAHPAFGGARVYNAALVGGHLYAIRRLFEHAVEVDPRLSRAIFGLDFFMFSDKLSLPQTFLEDRLQSDTIVMRDLRQSLASLDALQASIRTVMSNLTDPGHEPYYDNGMLTAMDMRQLVERRGMIERFDSSLGLYLNSSGRYADFAMSERAFDDLQRIITLSREHGIALTLFLSPEHASLVDAMGERGLLCAYYDWKRRIAALHPVWDFSGYSAITTEPIAFRMMYWWDASHYRKPVGDMVLDRIVGSPDADPKGFGVRLTAANADAVVKQDSARMIDWLKQTPAVAEQVRRNKKSIGGEAGHGPMSDPAACAARSTLAAH